MQGIRVARPAGAPRFVVSGDGAQVASRAGTVMLRELATATGLSEQVTGALADTYAGPWWHPPGQVFADLAVAVADGATSVEGIEALSDRGSLHGARVASDSTAWRLVDRIDATHRDAVARARAAARERAWAAGAAPKAVEQGAEGWLHIDVDATIVTCDSEKQNAAATWKKTFGHHPLIAALDRPEIAGGELLTGLLRAGNAGSNTAADHVQVLNAALEQLPAHVRPDAADAPRVLVRSDSAGATHAFARHCRQVGVGFSFGVAMNPHLVAVADAIPEKLWQPAINAEGSIRDGAWVVEVTGSPGALNEHAWPQATRLILRAERPHPGAQLGLHNTTSDGMRLTGFITDTPPGRIHGHVAGLDLRHRQHARIEDRIKDAKATGLANLPAWDFTRNQTWLDLVATATDLLCWTRLLAFAGQPALARATPRRFRDRVLHIAARLTRTGRRLLLRLDASSRWATPIATGWNRLRAAFADP